jgi:hypothetical protein
MVSSGAFIILENSNSFFNRSMLFGAINKVDVVISSLISCTMLKALLSLVALIIALIRSACSSFNFCLAARP